MVSVLALDNSTQHLSIAYGECSENELENNNYYHEVHVNNASNFILPNIKKIINGNIPDYIALSIGPGGFTGIRLACSIAMGLALSWNIKIIPLCSLLCAIESFRCGYTSLNSNKNSEITSLDFSVPDNRIIIDARMNEIYTRTFSYENNQYNLGSIELLNIQSEFNGFENKNDAEKDILYSNPNKKFILTNIENYKYYSYFAYPHALGLLSLVYNNLDFACDPHQIQLNYIRNKVANTIAERII